MKPVSAYVHLPSSQLDQTLINLVLNARDAGAANIAITATMDDPLSTERGLFTIDVLDDGQGMSEYVLARATDELFSANKPLGTGLGLSTVKRIVKAAGGKLELRNRERGGTHAHIALPGTSGPQ